jgi:hypothetical protein
VPLQIEKKPKRQLPPWVFSVAGLLMVVLSIALTWIVLAAVVPD